MPGPVTFAELCQPADLFDRADVLQFPARLKPRSFGPGGAGTLHLTLETREELVQLHPQLGRITPIWGYEGQYPGPAIEVPEGSKVRLRFRNAIQGTQPYEHVVVVSGTGSMNDAGSNGASQAAADVEEQAHVADLHAWTVVHLHGAPSLPDSDGWAENMIGTGEVKEDLYEFPRESFSMPAPGPQGALPAPVSYAGGAGPMFWYHDHGMSVTRFNVFAGLAGAWVVRSPFEAQLGLPVGTHELPLVLQDRNLETADGTANGTLTGRLLHKVETDVRECFAPVNLVNGKIWPRCKVRRRVYRLRLVNGSNARVYRLHFMGLTGKDESTRQPLGPDHVAQIGTDGGLLGAAVDISNTGLILAPGERADVLVDFGQAALDGFRHVVVYNSAAAPFQGAPLGSPAEIYTPDPDPNNHRTIPQVMRFDLQGGQATPGVHGHSIAGMVLDLQFRRVPANHGQLPADHGHSLVVLREEDVIQYDNQGQVMTGGDGNPLTQSMLFLHEMMEQSTAERMGMNMHAVMVDGVDANGVLTKVPAGISVQLPDHPGVTWVTVAKRFNDAASIFIRKGSWHLWKILNLSPDTHPFHIHLVQFQAFSRVQYPVATPDAIPKAATELSFGAPPQRAPGDTGFEPNELGWKDTIRVNPGLRGDNDAVQSAEMVSVLGCFQRHAGRYMYHCHILEHEDTEMMRPYVVVPAETMAFMSGMAMPGHSHS